MSVSNKKLILVLALVLLLSPLPCAAQNIRLYPVDESHKDRSFKIFRDQLLAALRRRDKQFLLSVLHPDIMNSLGGSRGVKEFVEQWKLNSSHSKVWSELYKILLLGGTFDQENGEKTFSAPYVSSRWDRIQPKLRGEFAEVSYEAIIGSRVRVYSRPDLDAPVLTRLSYDVVEVDYPGSIQSTDYEFIWVKIMIPRDEADTFVQLRSDLQVTRVLISRSSKANGCCTFFRGENDRCRVRRAVS